MALMVILCVAVLAYANALTIHPFENETTRLQEVWKETYPGSPWPRYFQMTYGDGHLWFVTEMPGRGIVSRLRVSTKEWDHKPYNLSKPDHADSRYYSQKGQLFMLLKKMDNHNLELGNKLFYWVHSSGSWSEVPLQVERAFCDGYAGPHSFFHVAMPMNEGNVVYLVVSAYSGAPSLSPSEFEFGYGKMEVTFSGPRPVNATVKKIVRQKINEKVAAVNTGMHGDKLFSLVKDMLGRQNYTRRHKTAYTVDLATKQLKLVNLTGDHPPSDFTWYLVFQMNQDQLVVGGITGEAPDDAQVQYDIWTVDMRNGQWKKATSTIRFGDPRTSRLAYDPMKMKIYVARSEGGIQLGIAKVSG